MQAYLYKYNGPQNKIDKEWTETFDSPSFIYKKPTDEYTPDLEFMGALGELRQYNYAGIEGIDTDGNNITFIYHIKSWESVRNTYCVAHAELDTLTTYKKQILNSTALVSRSENSYNLWFRDPSVDTFAYKVIDAKHIASLSSDDNYIAVVVGK